jgi:fucose 4-O-acetylase-like acetyltransferase
MANINTTKERLPYIDSAKAIGILLVIIGHCESINTIPYLRGMIYSFHMPLFFIISGMFIRPMLFTESIKKYFRTLLVYYIKTQLLILFILLIINIYFWDIDTLGNYVFDWWKKLLFIDLTSSSVMDRPLTGPIWFLVALFWGSIIY